MTLPSNIRQVACDEISHDEENPQARIQKFVADVLLGLVPRHARIITFDGFDGVGKSTIGRHLATSIAVPIIEIDAFLHRQQDQYLEAIDFSALSTTVSDALASAPGIIVEGCCVEDVLDRIDRTPQFRFYLMRVTRTRGDQAFESIQEYEVLCSDTPTEQVIREAEDLARQWTKMPEEFGGGGSGELPPLERELITYHRARRPHEHADVVVKIVHWS